MKLSWILPIHLIQLGWSAFVAYAIGSGHALWWEGALAAALVAVDGGITIAQTQNVKFSILPLKLSISKKP